jgi:Cof subfamily protein (haloacid dehalogenase superfamily)
VVYRLLAINIDGTLVGSKGKLQKNIKEAIDFVREKGVYVTLMTSRNFQSAQKVAKTLKINTTLVTHSGAFVSDALDKPLFEKRFSAEQTEGLVRLLEHYQCNIRISHERFSLGNRKQLQSTLVAKAILSNADPIFYPVQFVESISHTLSENPVAAPKVDAVFFENEEKESALRSITSMFPQVKVIQSEGHKVEFVPQGVSKLVGLQKLGEKLSISLQDMVAIGDSISDMEVIQSVGLGVAMGNAPIELKQEADWITRSHEDNGVSYMIIEHFRKQFPLPFLKQHKIIKHI